MHRHPRNLPVLPHPFPTRRSSDLQNDSIDATKVYNKMTIAELTQAAPGFDWTGFIRGVGVGDDSILVAQPSAFSGEAKLISEAPIGVIRDLLLVRSLDGFSDVLPEFGRAHV